MLLAPTILLLAVLVWAGRRVWCAHHFTRWLESLPHHNPIEYHSHRSRLPGHTDSWVYPPYGEEHL